MESKGAIYTDKHGNHGICHARKVQVKDTTSAGVSIGLTYDKMMPEAIEICSYLAASFVTSSDNVCPRFLPKELRLEISSKL